MQNKMLICVLNFVRPRDFKLLYGISRQTAWRYVRSGRLVPPTQISPGICGWDRAILDAFFCISTKNVNDLIESNATALAYPNNEINRECK